MWNALAKWAWVETERLILRPFRYTDAQDLYAILSDPDNTRFIHPSLDSLELCQTLLVEAFMRQPLGIWALEDKASGRMIGSIRLEQIQVRTGQAEIGYFLHRDFWRRGLGKEALEQLVFLSFSQFPLRRLIIKTHEENRASQALAESVGFEFDRQYKGSDRYSHRMRTFKDYRYDRKDYQLKETK